MTADTGKGAPFLGKRLSFPARKWGKQLKKLG
jgi:hypothetical protein